MDPSITTIDKAIEQRASVAPRVTMADIEAEIVSECYFTAADGVDGENLAVMRSDSPDESIAFRPLNSDNGKAGTPMAALSLLTFCVLTLHNGFTVTGESACASPENFDADIGRRVARANAIDKMWPLLGFRLRDQLSLRSDMGRLLAVSVAAAKEALNAPEGMVAYQGTKTLFAKPLTRGAYNEYRGWPTPADENPNDDGYFVEYVDGGKPNDLRHAGYISWSPADVFERSYRPL